MKLSNLTFIITDDCNFDCTYCMQKKEKKYMDKTTIKMAVDFFYPLLKDEPFISFYGGEPLLAFDLVEYAVQLLKEKNKDKKYIFYLTTNGSLLTDEMEAFFDRHKFGLTLSFDGTAQEEGREKGSLDLTVQAMKRIKQYPGIDLEINSVFTPRTVSTLTESVRFINEHNGPDIFINMDTTAEWTPQDLDTLRDELKRLGDFLLCHYKEKGVIPVKSFQATDTLVEADTMNERKKGVFRCSAGQDRMAVTPDGELWGCFLFHDYYKGKENNPEYRDYSFGTLTGFITGHKTGYPGIVKNYSELRQDLFQVKKEKGGENEFCFLCEYMEGCVACPVNAAYSSGTMGVISCRNCELKKIQRDAQTHFRKELRSLDSQPE